MVKFHKIIINLKTIQVLKKIIYIQLYKYLILQYQKIKILNFI